MVSVKRVVLAAALLLPDPAQAFSPTLDQRFPYLRPSLTVSAAASSSVLDPDKVDEVLAKVDSIVLSPLVRVANHVPALASIAYFGLISTAGMAGMTMFPDNTLASVLTKNVGPTSNAVFSTYFSTLITPANFVFLVWPFISVVQLVTVAVSALRLNQDPLYSQRDLTTLSASNLAATAWLLVSSRATETVLPLGSLSVLPLVPLISGYPLRQQQDNTASFVFQVYSSFTTLAAVLALAVELQYGGRIPFFLHKPELCASVFVGLTSLVVSLPNRSTVKKVLNAGVITGILAKRVADAGSGGLLQLFTSISFLGTVTVAVQAFKKLLKKE